MTTDPRRRYTSGKKNGGPFRVGLLALVVFVLAIAAFVIYDMRERNQDEGPVAKPESGLTDPGSKPLAD